MGAYDYAIAWAGMVMLFDFSMWSGGVLEWYYNTIYKMPKFVAKPLGTCKVCFCFWFGSIGWVSLFELESVLEFQTQCYLEYLMGYLLEC